MSNIDGAASPMGMFLNNEQRMSIPCPNGASVSSILGSDYFEPLYNIGQDGNSSAWVSYSQNRPCPAPSVDSAAITSQTSTNPYAATPTSGTDSDGLDALIGGLELARNLSTDLRQVGLNFPSQLSQEVEQGSGSSSYGLTPTSGSSLGVQVPQSRAGHINSVQVAALDGPDGPLGAASKTLAGTRTILPKHLSTNEPMNRGLQRRSYVLPPKTQRRRRNKAVDAGAPKTVNGRGSKIQKKRQPFSDPEMRNATAQTRKDIMCIRCRELRIRCLKDLDNPTGPCLCCKAIQRQDLKRPPVMCKLPCLRWKITDCSLYREQDMPYQMFSRRWKNMDLVDINTWASAEVKKIEISQIFLDAPYEVEVREFRPIDGDMVQEQWTSGGVTKSYQIPRYALADIVKTAKMLYGFIKENVEVYIRGYLQHCARKHWRHLLYRTYIFARQRSMSEETPREERELLENCLWLWVGCRKTSNPHQISGPDKLGATEVNDPASLFHGVVPMPVIMIAQMECIMYSTVLRPLAKDVLRQLNELVTRNKRELWLTIYLATFLLLHSCAMLTLRDWQTARQYDLKTPFANPESIRRGQHGALIMLAHFHYLNKGNHPFHMEYNEKGLAELSKAASLDADGLDFVKGTSEMIKEPNMVATMSEVREQKNFGHDLYWISQLYEQDWKPGSTA